MLKNRKDKKQTARDEAIARDAFRAYEVVSGIAGPAGEPETDFYDFLDTLFRSAYTCGRMDFYREAASALASVPQNDKGL